MKTLRRVIETEVRILDEKAGVAQYVASDETLDSYREVIRVAGWRFNLFNKNSPFVDSHDYWTIEKLLGSVVDFAVEKGARGNSPLQLVETVQWAKDVPENRLAQLGWKMTVAGFLKAVSVGFQPTRWVSKWDKDPSTFYEQAAALGLKAEEVRAIYLEQEQIELSAVIIGANPNALAKAYKAEVIGEDELSLVADAWARGRNGARGNSPLQEEFPGEQARSKNADTTDALDGVVEALHRERRAAFFRSVGRALERAERAAQ